MNNIAAMFHQSDKDVTAILPFVRQENGCFVCKEGKRLDLYQIKPKDFASCTDVQIEADIYAYTKFFRTYPSDVKFISMNFPVDTVRQIEYFENKLNATVNEIVKYHIKVKLEQLKYIGKNTFDKEFYLMIFEKDEEKLKEMQMKIYSHLESKLLAEKMTSKKKRQIIFKLCNKCTSIFDENWNEDKSKDRQGQKEKADKAFIDEIKPAGGLSFKDEKFIRTGNGYEACIHIYKYPSLVNILWLSDIMNIKNAIITLDVGIEDKAVVLENLKKATSEQRSRQNLATETSEYKDAAQRLAELNLLYDEVKYLNEVVRVITARVFIATQTLVEADAKIKDTINTLNENGYKACVFINESKNEWISQFQSYSEQLESKYKRLGQPIQALSLAGGNPFNYITLADKNGSYLGQTVSTDSSVIFDYFQRDAKRKSYSGLAIGKQRSGKSTLLKWLLLDNAIRGNYTRIIDATGEFKTLTDHIGGTTLNLADGGLNALEIFKSNEDENTCFSVHISKLATYYKFLSPKAEDDVIGELKLQLTYFYESIGFIEGCQYTGRPASEYPIWGDFEAYLAKMLQEKTATKDPVQLQLKANRMGLIQKIHRTVQMLIKNYGPIVNHHSSIQNLLREKTVVFDIKDLAKMGDDIFDAQLYNALFLAWDNCVQIGSIMKRKWESEEISWEDVKRFLFLIDESHKTINAQKLQALKQVNTFVREAPKFFGGMFFASHNLSDFYPEGSSQDGILELQKLFGMLQYKFILQQDSSSGELMKSAFRNELTEAEIDKIPKFETGQAILSISGVKNIEMNIKITDYEKSLFQGGA